MNTNTDLQLGQFLIEKELITDAQLAEAVMKQKGEGGMLADILLEMGYIEEKTTCLIS